MPARHAYLFLHRLQLTEAVAQNFGMYSKKKFEQKFKNSQGIVSTIELSEE
jgi:hypothetical protein